MKKFIINLILIMLIVPSICLGLVACKDKKDISKFYETYLSIADNYIGLKTSSIKNEYNLQDELYKVEIDYSVMPALQEEIDLSSSKYNYLSSLYNNMLNATLEPLYIYTPKVAESKLNKSQINKLYDKLEVFKQDLYHLVYTHQVLNTYLQASTNNDICLGQLNRVFKQYEITISSAGDLSFEISNIYYDKVLAKFNTNYTALKFEDFTETELTTIQVNMKSNFHYYKAMFASAYNQLLISNNTADNIINETSLTIPAYTPYDSLCKSNIVEKNISVVTNNKLAIYNRLNSLYNMQANINNHYTRFNKAITNKESLQSTNDIKKEIYDYSIHQFATGICYDCCQVVCGLITNLFILQPSYT